METLNLEAFKGRNSDTLNTEIILVTMCPKVNSFLVKGSNGKVKKKGGRFQLLRCMVQKNLFLRSEETYKFKMDVILMR